MAWRLTAGAETRPDRGSARMSLAFDLDGEAVEVVLSALDAAQVRRVLAGYVAKARAEVDELSDIAKVRRWARSNGHAVSARGRVARHVLDAYNLVHRTNVVDQSGRQRAAAVTIESIESSKVVQSAARRHNITSEIVIVDADGTQHPFHPDLLKPPTPADRARPGQERPFDWQMKRRR